jgi:hypothetical protein
MKHVKIFPLFVFILFILSTIAFPNNKIRLNWDSEVSLPKDYFVAQSSIFSPKGNPLLYSMNQNNLVNDEIMGEGNSFGKQMGIYGLEFLGAEIGAIAITYYIGLGWAIAGDIESDDAIYAYALLNSAITPTCCWVTGRLLKQDGSIYKTIMGTAIGVAVGSIYVNKWVKGSGSDGLNICMLTALPAIGAVIGYNF